MEVGNGPWPITRAAGAMAESQRRQRRRLTRRGFIGVTGMGALIPLFAACGLRGRRSAPSPGSAGTARGAAPSAPVRGGTLTVRSFSDVSLLDYAFNHDVYSGFAIANCVEALLTHATDAQPLGLLATSWETPDAST